MTEGQRKVLLKAQQGELDGVETYRMLASVTHNERDKETFMRLAADEGRHASVFRQYTGEILKPKKFQARLVIVLYHLLGKRMLYPLIAKFEYAAIPGYEKLEKEFPNVKSVKEDEKKHGDAIKVLLDNGEYTDAAKWPWVACAIVLAILAGRECSKAYAEGLCTTEKNHK